MDGFCFQTPCSLPEKAGHLTLLLILHSRLKMKNIIDSVYFTNLKFQEKIILKGIWD